MRKEKKYLTKEDIKKIHEENNFIPITCDRMFKNIFMSDKRLLKQFLFSQFDFNLDINECEIAVFSSDMVINNYEELRKTADMIIIIDDNPSINIELKQKYFKSIKDEKLLFNDKQTISENEKLHIDSFEWIFIELNLDNIHRLNDNYGKLEHGSDIVVKVWKNNESTYNENKIIMVKYLEYYRDLYYNEKKKLTDSEMWLVLLSCKSFKELYELSSIIFDIDTREKFMKKTITLMDIQAILEDWQLDVLEKNARYFEEDDEEDIRKESMEKGIQKEKKQTIINMLKENIAINTISKVTNKSEEEILEIKSKLN